MLRSPNRLHERISFFKYMPASTAKVVLDNSTLRWSSPSLFNDPFDVPRELSFGITPAQIIEALGKRCVSLVENPPEDSSDLESNLKTIVDTVKNGAPLAGSSLVIIHYMRMRRLRFMSCSSIFHNVWLAGSFLSLPSRKKKLKGVGSLLLTGAHRIQ